ncbi:MAG: PEP-CTERM sorting domain-containing protein [Microcystis aeruginosa Ma_QC_C_20070823_S13]|nr:MAG: PEP-CTERM sorting domain-containing protein [Microcystis aeruginosa Ma_QC_C_20070823_S13D]TRU65318.1 MAG: PEP-CTERM sorting domain-containing protein [Microcystis aeruginosa Ma_QC_C_20070823_S13]
MKITKSILLAVPLVLSGPLSHGVIAQTAPTTRFQGNISGVFTNADTGVVTGLGTNNFTWGVGSPPPPSRLTFTGKPFDVNVTTGYVYGPRARNDREVFSLGTLDYFNGTIQGGTGANSVRLDVTTQVTSPVGTNPTTFQAPLNLINSPNTSDPIASADSVFLPKNLPPVVMQTLGGAPITLEIPGFGTTTGSGFSTIDQFFVLEGGTATADLLGRFVPACEPIVNGATSVSISGPTITATFQPKFNLTISQAAQLCGYDHFNWYQVIDTDPNPPGGLSVPYVDPPIGGGPAFGGFADNLPFYWDEQGATGTGYHLQDNLTANTLHYEDTPSEPSLTAGQFLGFNTFLVGVLPDNTWDTLYAFSWKSNFNGTVGGVSSRRTIGSPDPGGTGGVFDLQLDLNPDEVPEEVRNLMERDGSRNASTTIEPAAKVPEPSTLLGTILALGVGLFSRKAKKNQKH